MTFTDYGGRPPELREAHPLHPGRRSGVRSGCFRDNTLIVASGA